MAARDLELVDPGRIAADRVGFRTERRPTALVRKTRPVEVDARSDDALMARHVETAPAYPTPDRARLVDSGASVTAVITRLRLEGGDREAEARAYPLSPVAIDAALACYARHRDVIDARITRNRARFAS